MIKNFLNPKGHPHPISGSKVKTILLKGWILPIGGASSAKGVRLQPAQQACLHTIQVLVVAIQLLSMGMRSWQWQLGCLFVPKIAIKKSIIWVWLRLNNFHRREREESRPQCSPGAWFAGG